VTSDGRENAQVSQLVREAARRGLLRARTRPALRRGSSTACGTRASPGSTTRRWPRAPAFALCCWPCSGPADDARPAHRRGRDAAGESLADRLLERLERAWKAPDLSAALMLALSMQPATTIRPEMRAALVSIALRGRLGKVSFDGIVSSYAALALGRIGNPDDVRPLLDMLAIRTLPVFVKRSAALALGQLGEHAAGPARASIVTGLWKAYEASRDPTVRSFALMSLGRVLAAEAGEGRDRRARARAGHRRELPSATDGVPDRPFGASRSGSWPAASGAPDAVAASCAAASAARSQGLRQTRRSGGGPSAMKDDRSIAAAAVVSNRTATGAAKLRRPGG
jgi:hypothetical protein